MTTRKPAKKPTPIKAPEPIIFPTPPKGINLMTPAEFLYSEPTTEDIPHPEPQTQHLRGKAHDELGNLRNIPVSHMIPVEPPISVELRNYIAHCIALTLYKVAEWAEAEIATMGQAQFEALCRSILEDDEG